MVSEEVGKERFMKVNLFGFLYQRPMPHVEHQHPQFYPPVLANSTGIKKIEFGDNFNWRSSVSTYRWHRLKASPGHF